MRLFSAEPGSRAGIIVLLVLVLLGIVLAAPTSPAWAVRTLGSITVTVDPALVRQPATYVIERIRTDNGETVTGYTIAFPADTDVSSATSPGAGDTVTVIDSTTIRVDLGTPIPQRTTFSIEIGDVRNPTMPGAYRIDEVMFHRPMGDMSLTFGATEANYDIVPTPFLSLTITTPDPGQQVAFGTVDPGVASGPQEVGLVVESSSTYLISRTLSGDAALMGLDVSGTPTDPQPAGTDSFTDNYVLTPPWTSEPEIDYVATVTYSVVQQ